MQHFDLYIGLDKKYHWRLRAKNGEIVCWSEGYETRQGALNSIGWVKRNAPTATISA